MKIIVLLKQVHDPNTPASSLRVSVDGHSMALPAGSNPILNGYDANALEAAVRLKESHGGTLHAISLGGDSAKEALRRAIALGADGVVHVSGEAGATADSDLTARLLAAAIRSLGEFNFILVGRSASDTDAGVVGGLVAGYLGIPIVTPARAVEFDSRTGLTVERLTDNGVRKIQVTSRAVIGISSEINKPRTPQLKGVVAAKRATIPTVDAGILGVETDPALYLRRLFVPERKAGVAEILSASSPAEAGRSLADRLHAEGFV